ncbi:protein cordon-bleu [Orussus abietinus]|uniref:protein cordon-bleu n=1 Tax=Orussus abietinus TaxID=222816 RepID=UPI0006266B1F|nr:protein cordon-bleu [Orussus abietinus]
MVLTVTEDTPADMLTGSMELLVQLPRDHHLHTQRVTVQRSTPMMDLLVQIATAHKLAASSYTLQAVGERGLVLPHQPNTPIGALDALQVKLLPKQGTFVPRKARQANQPFETTFRLQVHLPRNQLYVSRVSPKTNLGEILDEVCREKNLDRNKYELRHPANLEETLDLSLSLQDYHLQEVTLYAKQGKTLGSALSSQDIMALQRQEERRRQQAKQGVFGFMFKKSKESSLSTDSLGGRSASPARSDETGRSASPLAPPARPVRKRRPAPKPPVMEAEENSGDPSKEKIVISHSRNSSDSSGYHEASVLSDNPDSAARMPETLPRRSRPPGQVETSRKLAQTSQASKSLGNLAAASSGMQHGISNTSLSSTGLRKKRAAPPPPIARPLSSAISTQALERIVDSEESLTSDMDLSKPPSDIGAPSKANSDIDVHSGKAISDIVVNSLESKRKSEPKSKSRSDLDVGPNSSPKIARKPETDTRDQEPEVTSKTLEHTVSETEIPSRECIQDPPHVEPARVAKRVGVPVPKPRKLSNPESIVAVLPKAPKRKAPLPSPLPRTSLERAPIVAVNGAHENGPQQVETASPSSDTSTSEDGPTGVRNYANVEEHPSFVHENLGTGKENVSDAEENDEESRKMLPSRNEDPIEQSGVDLTSVPSPENLSTFEEGKLEDNVDVSETEKESNDKSQMSSETSERIFRKGCGTFGDRIQFKIGIHDPSNDEMMGKYLVDDGMPRSLDNASLSFDNESIGLRVSKDASLKLTKSTGDIYKSCASEDEMLKSIGNPPKRRSCAVISTIPKCDHLVPRKEKLEISKAIGIAATTTFKKSNTVHPSTEEDANQSSDCNKTSLTEKEIELGSENLLIPQKAEKSPKRTNIFRSQSELNNFELSSSERHGRHLTSHAEDFVCAFNTNLSSNIPTRRDVPAPARLESPSKVADKSNLRKDSDATNLGEISQGNTNDSEVQSNSSIPIDRVEITRKGMVHSEEDVKSDQSAIGISDGPEQNLTETDILLRKVSDTLSNSLPSPPSTPTHPPDLECPQKQLKTTPVATESLLNKAAEALHEVQSTEAVNSVSTVHSAKKEPTSSDISVLRASTPNATMVHQQDTSDYVSATGEDLSITDWEYQLPAPPSAFRDSDSSTLEGYETITLRSVEAFKDTPGSAKADQPLISGTIPHEDPKSKDKKMKLCSNPLKTNPKQSRAPENEGEHVEKMPTPVEKRSQVNHIPKEIYRSTADLSLQKEVISELESKIETGCLNHHSNSKSSELEAKKTPNGRSAPKIAPVDNTLSNFTITTYSRQRSLDIYDEGEQQGVSLVKHVEERPTKSPAGVEKEKVSSERSDDTMRPQNGTAIVGVVPGGGPLVRKPFFSSSQNVDHISSSDLDLKKPEPKSSLKPQDPLLRHQSFNGDVERSNNVHRSKSYIALSNNIKYRGNDERDAVFIEGSKSRDDEEGMKKSVSVTNLSREAPRSNEKFSQWRDNILKRQEEPTKEKQLQSLQVLKSILPQLKNTQQADESVFRESNEAPVVEDKRQKSLSSERSVEPNVSSGVETRSPSEPQRSRNEEQTKRYSYTGPPTISLGSWSERPCVNVQIKMDTDYKFGRNNASGPKTIVSLNGTRDERDPSPSKPSSPKTLPKRTVTNGHLDSDTGPGDQSETRYQDELARKSTAHATVAGFKRPVLKKVGVPEPRSKIEDKSLAGPEPKGSPEDNREILRTEENGEVDEKPLNFRELTRAFGQDVCPRTKPKTVLQNRHSDYYGTKPEIVPNFTKVNQNGFSSAIPKRVERVNGVTMNGISSNESGAVPVKKYTTVVGIHSQGPNYSSQSGNFTLKSGLTTTKVNGPMPVVKGFKVPMARVESKIINVKQNGFVAGERPEAVPQPPKPPTMPVITGVTLKNASARPKSMPANLDPRDQLLESIRNFGGRDRLRSTAERY